MESFEKKLREKQTTVNVNHRIVIVPTYSYMFVTYWDSIRVIRRIFKLFRIDILLIPVCSLFFFPCEHILYTSLSIRDTVSI